MTRRLLVPTASLALLLPLLGCVSLPTVEEARSLSLADEWRLGEVLDAEMAHRLAAHPDAEAQDLLVELASPLAAATALGDRDWHFVLIDDAVPYSLHLPGGRLYVSTGLVESCDDASCFLGLLAHEIAHAGQRHGLQLIARSHGPRMTLTLSRGEKQAVRQDLAANLAAGGSFARLGEEAERRADSESMRLLPRIGVPAEAAAAARRRLLEREKPAGLKHSRYFTCHPMGREVRDGSETTPLAGSGAHLEESDGRFRSLRARLRR